MNDFTFAHRQEGFDNHIDQSIRNYSTLHDDIVKLSRYFVEDNTNVYDIGCSTGKTIGAMIDQNHSFAPKANYVGVEYAEGFKDAMQDREDEYPDAHIDLRFEDIRETKITNANLVTSIFTLQFMPRKDRRATLEKIYKGLNPGGAFIFAEKTIAESSRIQEMITFQYYDFKRQNFSEEDIMSKEVTLRNMLKPNTWRELTSMLACAGFDLYKIQPFWQNHMFVGAIVIK